MFKKLLIFSLYFYFAGLWVDADNEEQLKRQLNEFLQLTVEKSVPTYEFAVPLSDNKLRLINGISLTIKFQTNGESKTLQLYPLEHNVMSQDLRCWFITNYYPYPYFSLTSIDRNDFAMDGTFYQSINPRGVFFVSQSKNTKQYYGVYGEGEDQRVIEPLPNSLQYANITYFSDHIVHSMNPIKPTHTIIPVPDEITKSQVYLREQQNRRTPLKNFYPKLLLIVDGTYYTKFQNVFNIVRYLSVFFNIVGLRYAEVPSPKIQPIVTGIILGTNTSSLVGPLIIQSIIDPSCLDADYVLKQYEVWVKKELERNFNTFRNYDSALLITSYMGYYKNRKIIGAAEFALICYNKILYICDSNMNFGGVNAAIHELGHTMGLDHDNAPFLKDYNNRTFLYPSNSIYLSWSTYSIKSFQLFAQKEIANCLSVSKKV